MSWRRSNALAALEPNWTGLKRIVGVRALALVGLAGMACCYTFLFWNVIVIYEYFHFGAAGAAATDVGAANVSAVSAAAARHVLEPTSWPWQWTAATFRPLAVDLSAQTPFKLSMFFTLLFVSSVRSASGRLSTRDLRARSAYLPFFRTLETTFVQLGLAGSIWGFLLIGFGLANKTEARDAMPILLGAFGTSLLSTFTGVVLAFVAAPLVRGLWRWLHDIPAQVASPAVNLSMELERLRGTLRDALGPVEQMRGAFERSDEESGKLRASLTKTSTDLQDLSNRVQAADPAKLNEVAGNIEAWTAEVANRVGVVNANVAPLRDHLTAIQEDIAANLNAATDLAATAASVAPTLNGLAVSMRDMADGVTALSATLIEMTSSQKRLLDSSALQAAAVATVVNEGRLFQAGVLGALARLETKLENLAHTGRFASAPIAPTTGAWASVRSPSQQVSRGVRDHVEAQPPIHALDSQPHFEPETEPNWPPPSVEPPPAQNDGAAAHRSIFGRVFGKKRQ
jgi:hypothetical protein